MIKVNGCCLFLWSITLAAFGNLAYTARLIADGTDVLRAPRWPDTYEVEYTVELPYMKTIQPEGLKYPVHVWYDGPNQRYRYDAYDGLCSVGYDMAKSVDWYVHPRILEMDCYTGNATGGGGPIRRLLAQQLGSGSGLGPSLGDDTFPIAPIPDISHWSYTGTAIFGNAEEARVWQFARRHGDKTFEYQFYTSFDGLPLRLHMMGENLITGGHFDEYIIEFSRFKAGPIDQEIFELSKLCLDKMRERQQQPQSYSYSYDIHRAAAQFGMLLPSVRVGAAAPSGLSSLLPGLISAPPASTPAWEDNVRFVEEHNRRYRAGLAARSAADSAAATGAADAAPTYSLSLNHFATLSQEQFAASLLGRRKPVAPSSPAAARLTQADRVYRRVLTDDQLPDSVDWRGTGADGGVKDQACCGSCWTFSATAAMQGAWFTKTGQSRSFSEQQLLDCSWDYGTTGCDGGDVKPALQYLIDSGGIAAIEDEYPYMGKGMFCRGPFSPPRNHTSEFPTKPQPAESYRFTGYMSVPSRDEKALMEVLALHGPVSIGIDGGRRGFRFYAEGVFHDPHCSTASLDLDHAVVLVGYGTTPEGIDYWIVKNIWSKYWGMDGYMKITRKGNDCGVSTDAVMAVVEKVERSAQDDLDAATA